MTSVDRILNFCKENGIAVRKLESDLGFSNGYLTGVKRRGAIPDDRLKAIAKYLGVSVNYLIGEPEPPKLSEDDANLLNMFHHLDHMGQIRAQAAVYDILHEKKQSAPVDDAKDA